MSKLPVFALLMASLGLFISAGAASASVGPQDQNFVQAMAIANYAEIDASKLAKHRTKNDQVEDFAKQMIDDHEKNNKKLKKMAKDLNVTMPKEADDEHKAMADRLKQADKGDFDREYIKDQVAGHEKVVMLLKAEIQDGQDSALKAFASDSLPVVQEHLAKAKTLEARTGGGQ